MNIELLDQTLAKVEKLDAQRTEWRRRMADGEVNAPMPKDSWDQSSWGLTSACRTSGCFAGWACVLSGYTLDGTFSIPGKAQHLLGLTANQTDMLFQAGNGLDDLRDIVATLKEDPRAYA